MDARVPPASVDAPVPPASVEPVPLVPMEAPAPPVSPDPVPVPVDPAPVEPLPADPAEPPAAAGAWPAPQLAEASPKTPVPLPQMVMGIDGETSPTSTPTCPGARVRRGGGVGPGRPGRDRGLARRGGAGPAAPGPNRDVGRCQPGHPGPDPDPAGGARTTAATGLDGDAGAAGAGLTAAAADQPGQDPAVGTDPHLRGGGAADPGRDVGGDFLGAGGAGAQGQEAPAERGNADCALHPQVHLDLSFFSDFEDVEHVTRGR
jgi:hypothetical protein